MFSALIRHEARLQARPLLTMLGVALAVWAGAFVLVLIRLPFLATLGSIVMFGAGIAVAAVIPAYLLLRYYRSMYGREGYLTMALPVSAGTLYAAKFVWASVVWLLGLAVGVVMWLGAGFAQTLASGGGLADYRAMLADGVASIGTFGLTAVVLWSLVGVLIYVAQGGWIITLGMEDRFRKLGLGGPVVVWFLTYVTIQVLMIPAILFIPLGATLDMSALVFSSFLPEMGKALANEDPSFIPLGWLPVLLASGIVYVVWTLRSLRHHTSLR